MDSTDLIIIIKPTGRDVHSALTVVSINYCYSSDLQTYWLHSHRTTNLRGRSMMSRLLLRFSDRWPPAQSPILNLVTWDFRDWKYTQLLLVVEVYIEKYVSKSYSTGYIHDCTCIRKVLLAKETPGCDLAINTVLCKFKQ